MFLVDEIDFTAINNCCTWLDFTDVNCLIKDGSNYISYIYDKSRYKSDEIYPAQFMRSYIARFKEERVDGEISI